MIKTVVIEIDSLNIEEEKLIECSEILKRGGTVAFPTETVYGLGANGLETSSIKKIFEAKGRPSDNPLILHVSSIEEVRSLVKEIPEVAIKLMNTFWPGPLTLIFEKSELIPKEITGGLDTVAIRIPQHPIANKLIQLAGVPVAAPSANISGKPSPTKADHVVKDLYGRVDAIISGGNCDIGVESTVLDLTVETPTILRPGGVTKEMLEVVLSAVVLDPALEENSRELTPKSPGMKYTHYAPKAEVTIVKGHIDHVTKRIVEMEKALRDDGKQVGIICSDESKNKYTSNMVKSMGSRVDMKAMASNLFKILREFDETTVEIILAEAVEETGLGKAIMNRMLKAAGYRVIEV